MDDTEVIPVWLLAGKSIYLGHGEMNVTDGARRSICMYINSTRTSEFFICYEFRLAWGDTVVLSRLWPEYSDPTDLHRFPITLRQMLAASRP